MGLKQGFVVLAKPVIELRIADTLKIFAYAVKVYYTMRLLYHLNYIAGSGPHSPGNLASRPTRVA